MARVSFKVQITPMQRERLDLMSQFILFIDYLSWGEGGRERRRRSGDNESGSDCHRFNLMRFITVRKGAI